MKKIYILLVCFCCFVYAQARNTEYNNRNNQKSYKFPWEKHTKRKLYHREEVTNQINIWYVGKAKEGGWGGDGIFFCGGKNLLHKFIM